MHKRNQFRRGVHTNSRRKLRLESLETRRLLAGDACNAAELPSEDNTSNSVVAMAAMPESVQQLAGNFQAADAAGGSFATAAKLGQVHGTIQRRGTLSRVDRIDMASFEVTERSAVRVALDHMNDDADLYVLNRAGKLIASSTRSGTRLESLSGTLPSGEYFLAIVAMSHNHQSYRLTLDVQPRDSQATIPPQTSPPPTQTPPTQTPTPKTPIEEDEPATSSPAPPPKETTTRPLPDVAYFGGNQDWNINAVAAPESWAAGYRGQGVTVAVIDTGVDLDHPDLFSSLYVNPGEIAGNGIDDDRNGYVDDISGFDFVSGDARPDDGNGHGTHVAGIIAAGNNGVGTTGVAPDAKILPVRVLDNTGSGTDANVAAGIRYAANLGAQIINLSLGGGASARIASAIEYATGLGSLVIAAAGNESAATPSYPARYSTSLPSVLSVGAYDSANRIAGFSNGVGDSGAIQVDAPGVGIYSTYIGGGYRSLSGTSMASPHVSGVAALTLSANPNLTSAELRQLLATGTVGRSTGTDSLGRLSTLNSVAFAAGGFTTATGSNRSSIATTSVTRTRVHATGLVSPPILSTGPAAQWGTQSPDVRSSKFENDFAFKDLDAKLFAGSFSPTVKRLAFDPSASSVARVSTTAPRDLLFASLGETSETPTPSDVIQSLTHATSKSEI